MRLLISAAILAICYVLIRAKRNTFLGTAMDHIRHLLLWFVDQVGAALIALLTTYTITTFLKNP